jgi:hypothetical protein
MRSLAVRGGLRRPLPERRLADALLRALPEGDGGVAGMRSLAVRGGLRRPLLEGDERVDTDCRTTLPVLLAAIRSLAAAAARDGLRMPLPERRLAETPLRPLPEGDGGTALGACEGRVAAIRSLAAAARDSRVGLRMPLPEGDGGVDGLTHEDRCALVVVLCQRLQSSPLCCEGEALGLSPPYAASASDCSGMGRSMLRTLRGEAASSDPAAMCTDDVLEGSAASCLLADSDTSSARPTAATVCNVVALRTPSHPIGIAPTAGDSRCSLVNDRMIRPCRCACAGSVRPKAREMIERSMSSGSASSERRPGSARLPVVGTRGAPTHERAGSSLRCAPLWRSTEDAERLDAKEPSLRVGDGSRLTSDEERSPPPRRGLSRSESRESRRCSLEGSLARFSASARRSSRGERTPELLPPPSALVEPATPCCPPAKLRVD